MARFAHSRNSFLFGEVSPSTFGRADLEQYRQMCKEMKNMVPKIQGGAARRMGTQVLGRAPGPDIFFSNDAPWEDTDINDGSGQDEVKLIPYPLSDPPTNFSSTGFLVLSPTAIKRIGYETSGLVEDVGQISSSYGTDWQIAMADTGFPRGVEQWAQFGDFIVITNGIYPPLVVANNNAALKYFVWLDGELLDSGSLSTANMHRFLPFESTNTSATTFSLSLATVGVGRTLTASAATFSSGMVGRYVRGHEGGVVGLAVITGYTSSTEVTVSIIQAFNDTSLGTAWAFAEWGGDRGWPRAVSFFEERLCFAGNSGFPDKVWCSQQGDLYELSLTDPTATPGLSDCFAVNVGQNESGVVNGLFPKEHLFALTVNKETYLDVIDQDFSIGFGNTKLRSRSRRGSLQRQPHALDSGIEFIGGANRLLELGLNPQNNSYRMVDLSRYAPDITRDRVNEPVDTNYLHNLATTQSPDLIVWAVDLSGRLYSITRDIEGETFSWAHHPIGGPVADDYDGEEAFVMDLCVVNNILFLAVVRDIGNEQNRICFEFVSPEFSASELFDPDEDFQNMSNPPIYLDYATYMSTGGGPATDTFEGLDYLADQEVSVVADGNYIGEFTVDSNGDLTLDDDYEGIIVGFNYESRIVPTALEANALFGTGLGQVKRTEEVTVLFERTVAAKVGTIGREDEETEIQFRESSVPASDPIPLFSGEKRVSLNASYEGRQEVYVKQDAPYPMTVNAMIFKGILYD